MRFVVKLTGSCKEIHGRKFMQFLVVVRVKNVRISAGTNFALKNSIKETGNNL
jgi:hypothetical protein